MFQCRCLSELSPRGRRPEKQRVNVSQTQRELGGTLLQANDKQSRLFRVGHFSLWSGDTFRKVQEAVGDYGVCY